MARGRRQLAARELSDALQAQNDGQAPRAAAGGGTLASSIVAPSLRNRASAPFRVGDFKRECAAFIQQMEALLQDPAAAKQGLPSGLGVSDLQRKTLAEEMEELQQAAPGLQQQQQQAAAAAGQLEEHQRQEDGTAELQLAVPGLLAQQQVQAKRAQDQQEQQEELEQRQQPHQAGAGLLGQHPLVAAAAQQQEEGEHHQVPQQGHQGQEPEQQEPEQQQQEQQKQQQVHEEQEGQHEQPVQSTAQQKQKQRAQEQQGSRVEERAPPRRSRRQHKRPAGWDEHADVGLPVEAGAESEAKVEGAPEPQRCQRRARPAAAAPPAARAGALPPAPPAKPEALALLAAYQERAEAIRRRRAAEQAAAAAALHSVRLAGEGSEARGTREQELREKQLTRLGAALAQGATAGPAEARVPPGEVVLRVAVGIPHAPHQMQEEYLVLASQSLTELRDAIYCLSDVNAEAVEKQENESRAAKGLAPLQLVKPSGYLYVEGTFFNDMRREGAVDYSEPIRRHNREHRVPAPPHPPPGTASTDVLTTEFSSMSMEGVRFEDLWLRVGAGAANLYCHQGGCEHLLSFVDVRLHDPGADPPLLSQYPYKLASSMHVVTHTCEVCGQRQARHVTYDDPVTPHTPFFWCNDCYHLMHYGEGGQALHTDYRVFPYSHEYGTNAGGFSCPW